MGDESEAGFRQASIAELEEAVAALARQLDRAAAAHDAIAVAVEQLAICLRVRSLIHEYIMIAAEGSDEWVFVYGLLNGWVVERSGPGELTATGQVWCSGPWGGTEDWTEPFEARFRLSAGSVVVAEYTIRFGRRATLQDLAAVRAGVMAGNLPPPCPASAVSEWAYVFSGPAEPVVAPDCRPLS